MQNVILIAMELRWNLWNFSIVLGEGFELGLVVVEECLSASFLEFLKNVIKKIAKSKMAIDS